MKTFMDNLYTGWAIAAKDIVEAVKSKIAFGIMLSAIFVIVFYRYLPALESADVLPRLSLYDAGESQLVAELENSFEFDVYVAHSQDNMEAYVGDKDIVMLGLTLPAELDQTLATAEQVELDGYVVHWASEEAVDEVHDFFEYQLTELAGKPVKINLKDHIVYTRKESRGYAFLTAIGMVVTVTTIGYGDYVPLTLGGRVTATVLMFVGIGLLSVTTAGIAAYLVRLDQLDLLRLRRIRHHVVICGLGDKGLRLARSFRGRGRPVVVVERDETNARIRACQESGAKADGGRHEGDN